MTQGGKTHQPYDILSDLNRSRDCSVKVPSCIYMYIYNWLLAIDEFGTSKVSYTPLSLHIASNIFAY